MREAYLTGGDTAPETEGTPSQIWHFSSMALTDGYNLTITGTRMGDVSDEFTITRYCKPHPDMLRALRRLTLHMCLLNEELTPLSLYPQNQLQTAEFRERAATRALRHEMETGEAFVHPDLEKFRCLSVLWKPKGVVLKGVKKARYRFMGNELEVKTPTVEVRPGLRLDDDDDEPADWEYPYFDQMDNSLRELTAEPRGLHGGKYGEGGQQLELFGKDAPAPSVLEAMENLNDALDTELRQRNHSVARSLADIEAVFPTSAAEADEAAHANQLQKDAAGDEGTGLGTIPNPKKRPARRVAVKGGQSND